MRRRVTPAPVGQTPIRWPARKGIAHRALGRLPPGHMNRTETAYAAVLELRRQGGEIAWWKFEGIKLRLADSTFLTVDFAVMLADGPLEMHEVKGFMEEDANVKLKVAAALYPFAFRLVRRAGKAGWDITEIAA